MCAKGRVKWAYNQQPSLHERLAVRPFDERSDSGKPKGFRSSARRRVEARFAKEKQPSLQGIYELPGRCYLP